MTAETWEIKTVTISPFSGTKVICQNEDDRKWMFVRSDYYGTLYLRFWCDSHTPEQKTEVPSYGIGGFLVPAEFRHSQVQIGISANNQDWTWVIHNYHNGGTA